MVLDAAKVIITECGPINPGSAGIVDGHKHFRITPVEDLASQMSLLHNQSSITAGFVYCHQASSSTIVIYQLGGCDSGLTGLFTKIIPRLESFGFGRATIHKLNGENIATNLAHLFP